MTIVFRDFLSIICAIANSAKAFNRKVVVMSTYIISIDIGTQGTKAALFDVEMNLIDTAFEVSNLVSPEPGTIWQEPDEMYAAAAHVCRELLEKTGIHPGDVAAIGLDGQMAGIMGIDRSGAASTVYDSWLDMRCGPYMEQMDRIAGERVVALSGGQVTYVHGPKILWWKNERPDAYRNTAKWVLPHAYIVGRMCNLDAEHAYFDYTHLHFSCLSDNANKRWSDELLETFGIEKDKMARIVSPFDVVGHIAEEFSRLTGLPTGIPVVAGCGDTAASTFGSGMFEREMVLDCAGTASVLCSVVDSFNPDIEHRTLTMMRSPIDGLYLPLAYIGGGGLCVRWFRDELSGKPGADYDTLMAEAEKIGCGSEGLIFVPHFAGRVLPCNPNLKGAWLGLDLKHTRAHMYRSVMESIAYEYDYYLSVLRSLYPQDHFTEMLTIGGGAKSPLFNQIKADVMGLKVSTYEMGETALIAGAVIAGVGAGVLTDYAAPIRAAIAKGREFIADPAHHEAYRPYAKAYLNSMTHLTDFYKNQEIYR